MGNRRNRQSQCCVHKPPSLSQLYRKLGQVGKEKMHRIRLLSYFATNRPSVAALLAAAGLLSACAGGPPSTYVGTLTPVAGTCDVLNRASLNRNGETVQFTPQEGVTVLEGTISPSGAITASAQTMGMNRQPYRLAFTGVLHGQTMTGTYVTPRCRYTVLLNAAPD
jgi:hypothetical protein